jgi:N-acyl-D-aspartate/D-glutamate deacylase
MHDLVFRGALLLDGGGDPSRRGDLAVAGGRIVAVGEALGPARHTVEADGLALMPGIVDVHTHYDAQITWDPFVDPSLALGVTTVVIGNCGFTVAPCKPPDRDLTMRNLTHVEGMSLAALRAGIRWEFESFPDYLAMLERNGVGPNVAAFVGHSSIRTYVLGEDAAKRAATDDEIAAMAKIVEDAMAAGALGFATSTNEPHNGEGGIPMPSRLASDREMRALIAAMGRAGRGTFMLTKGGKTSIATLESWTEESCRPTIVAAMLHNGQNPEGVFKACRAMAAARARGHRLYPQVSCTPLTMDFTLESPYLFEGLAAWLPAMQAADGPALRRVYADPTFRRSVKDELVAARGLRLFNSEWDKVQIVEVAAPKNRGLEGKAVAELATAAGAHPLDWMLDFSLSEDLKTQFVAELLNSDEEAVGRLLADPDSNVALSDAGAHLTFLCDAGFGLHLLGHWARDLGKLRLEEAVRKLTGHQADLFGLKDRGRLQPGAYADLLLFDPATVGRGAKRRVFDLPTGAPRLTTPALGVHGVWVNSRQVADATGRLGDGARPGRVLRDFKA